MNDRLTFRFFNTKANKYMPANYVDETTVFLLARLGRDKYIIEQCTGLKDKNGTLIYEGDIVDILCEVEEQGVIEWAPEEAQFVVRAEQAGFVANFDNYRGTDLEVIGNIHEKPELLEDK